MKRIGILFVVLTVLFTVGITAKAEMSANLSYIIENEKVIITGMYDYTENLVIPSEIDRYPVSEIADNAFRYQEFYSVTIPGSVKRIGESAFDGCYYLETVIIEDGVKYLGDYTFYGCPLESLSLPDSIVSIGCNAFAGSNLYTIENDCLYLGNHLIAANKSFSGSYTVRAGTRSIAEEAFINFDMSGLNEIVFPDSLRGIGAYAFMSAGLTALKIPSSVEFIGEYAFSYCENLETISIPGSVSKIEEYAFDGCSQLSAVYTENPKWSYDFPEDVIRYDGSKDYPYPIKTAADLVAVAKAVNSGTSLLGVYLELTNDISLNGTEWTPIGTYTNPFSGKFNGNGYTVSDYQITKAAGDTNYDDYTGFFGYTDGATIQNLHLTDFSINIKNPEKNTYLGSFAGCIQSSTITACSATGDIIAFNDSNTAYETDIAGITAHANSSVISDTSANCNLYYIGNEAIKSGDTQVRIGGIAGYTYSQIQNCVADCNIYGSGLIWRVGGIAGDQSYGGTVKISDCTAKGTIRIVRNDAKVKDGTLHCGSIAGFNRELIQNCKSYVQITICGNKTASKELLTSSWEWYDWYCGGIFGVGYIGGNHSSIQNTAYGSIASFALPEKPELLNFQVEKTAENTYQYHVLTESLQPVTGKVIIALYNGKQLVGTDIREVSSLQNAFPLSGNITASKTADYAKIFLWNDISAPKPLASFNSLYLQP